MGCCEFYVGTKRSQNVAQPGWNLFGAYRWTGQDDRDVKLELKKNRTAGGEITVQIIIIIIILNFQPSYTFHLGPTMFKRRCGPPFLGELDP